MQLAVPYKKCQDNSFFLYFQYQQNLIKLINTILLKLYISKLKFNKNLAK